MNTKRFFGVCAAAVLTLAGCASTSAPKPTATVSDQNPDCVISSTASRLPATTSDCSASGHSYSSEDIRRTGATTVGGAMQLLDPSATIGH
jgi:hypothetical protein